MADRNQIKEFIKSNKITDEMFKRALHRFDLEDIDLNLEKSRIEEKKSSLSARQRKAVMELCLMKELMEEIENEKKIEEKINESIDYSTN